MAVEIVEFDRGVPIDPLGPHVDQQILEILGNAEVPRNLSLITQALIYPITPNWPASAFDYKVQVRSDGTAVFNMALVAASRFLNQINHPFRRTDYSVELTPFSPIIVLLGAHPRLADVVSLYTAVYFLDPPNSIADYLSYPIHLPEELLRSTIPPTGIPLSPLHTSDLPHQNYSSPLDQPPLLKIGFQV